MMTTGSIKSCSFKLVYGVSSVFLCRRPAAESVIEYCLDVFVHPGIVVSDKLAQYPARIVTDIPRVTVDYFARAVRIRHQTSPTNRRDNCGDGIIKPSK